MTIFLPIDIRPTGGTSTFAQKFQSEAKKQGYQVIFSFTEKYDVLLVPVSCPWKYLIHAKQHNRPIIHRLDGTYYPATTAGYLYPLYNLKPKIILHRFATSVIYQSSYSKHCCDIFLGRPKKQTTYTIHNGVDTTKYPPLLKEAGEGSASPKPDISTPHVLRPNTLITWSRFRRPDQINPVLEAFKKYQASYDPNAKLTVIGDFTGPVKNIPQKNQSDPAISFTGPLPQSEIINHARQANLFLITHQNPPCPNNVLEAMSLGLPICGVNDGAMSELTTPGQSSELITVQGNGFKKPRNLDTSALAANINKIMQSQETYSRNARAEVVKKFQLSIMTIKYLKTINEVLPPDSESQRQRTAVSRVPQDFVSRRTKGGLRGFHRSSIQTPQKEPRS